MTTPYITEISMGYGIIPSGTPIVNLPHGTERYKIKSRNDCFAVVFVKTADEFSAWYCDYTSKERNALRLSGKIGINFVKDTK